MSYHHGRLKEALLVAGADELRARGAEHLSLREVAKIAGVSHNAPYRHFRDKTDFIEQILERALRELSEQIQTAPLLYPISVLMQMRFVGRLWAQMAIRHPRQAHMLFTGLHDNSSSGPERVATNALHAANRLLREQVSSLIEAAIGTEIKPETNCQSLALLLVAAFRGLAVLHTSRAEGDLIESDDDLYELCDMAAENILRPMML